jgi:hypothetical protein
MIVVRTTKSAKTQTAHHWFEIVEGQLFQLARGKAVYMKILCRHEHGPNGEPIFKYLELRTGQAFPAPTDEQLVLPLSDVTINVEVFN